MSPDPKTESFMALAIAQAKAAAQRGEVPVGAVLIHQRRVIACAGNRTLELHDPTAHAEILVIREACQQANSQRLPDFDLYVTLEPCTMCAAAISFARIRRLYIAAEDAKAGAVLNGARFYDQPNCHHAPEIYSGIGESEASRLLKSFFQKRRNVPPDCL
ncbi:MAG: nucleoside deaminase [Ahrensia sp.]|nr:nucleoside deaminase [Ahrensia sp.]